MSDLEVLMLMMTLLSPLFFEIGFFVGRRSGKANERLRSVYVAKEHARETRIVIEEIRANAIDECVKLLKETHYMYGKTDYIQAIEDLEQLKEKKNV